jgi:membrane-associated phospholipid phosphatase
VYVGVLAQRLLTRSEPDSTPATRFNRFVRWRWLAASGLLWAVFAGLTYLATMHPYLGPDLALARWVQAATTGPLALTFPVIDWLSGNPGTGAALAVLALVGLAHWRQLPFAVVVELGATETYQLVNQGLKLPRPTSDLVRVMEHPGAYGWPSGHANFALVQVGVLLLCVVRVYVPRRFLPAAVVLGALVVALFVIERVSVGVHWPSQTLGGLLVAAGWLTLALGIRWLSDPVLAGRPLGDRSRTS